MRRGFVYTEGRRVACTTIVELPAACTSMRHHRGCVCGPHVHGTRNDQTPVGAHAKSACVLETWASPRESRACRSRGSWPKPAGAECVCVRATIVATCAHACLCHHRSATGPLDVHAPFGGGVTVGTCACLFRGSSIRDRVCKHAPAAISTAVTRADAMTVEKAARDLTLLLNTAPPTPSAAH